MRFIAKHGTRYVESTEHANRLPAGTMLYDVNRLPDPGEGAEPGGLLARTEYLGRVWQRSDGWHASPSDPRGMWQTTDDVANQWDLEVMRSVGPFASKREAMICLAGYRRGWRDTLAFHAAERGYRIPSTTPNRDRVIYASGQKSAGLSVLRDATRS